MTTHTSYRLLAVLVTLILLMTTMAGTSGATTGALLIPRLVSAATPAATSNATPTVITEDQPEQDDSGGRLDGVIDGAGKVVGDIKDTTVDVAESSWEVAREVPGAAWDAIEDVPGTVWDFVKQIPGTIAQLWEPVWDVLQTRFEIPGLAIFLVDHPLLRLLLTPILFLFGIAYDGTMSFLDAGLISLALIVPIVKSTPILLTGIEKAVPWTSKTKVVVTTIRRNPDGIVAGVGNAFRFSRARSIAPTSSSIEALPRTPGVYIALDASGKPLYVGSTNSFSRRLTEHFITGRSRFAEQTASIKLLPTETTTSARILECSLIKQLKPSNNILLTGGGPCPIFLPPSPKVFFTP